MALDNWFQNWHPPHFQQPFFDPGNNYSDSHEFHSVKKTPNPNKLLPFFLSLSLLKPSERSRHRPDTFFRSAPPRKRKYEHPSKDSHRVSLERPGTFNEQEPLFHKNEDSQFRIPLEHPGVFSEEKKESYRKEPFLGIPLELSGVANKKDKNVNEKTRAKTALKYPGFSSSREKSYEQSYTDYMGFPDPFDGKVKSGRENGNMTYEEEHHLRPLELTGPFKTWYRWKTVDLKYPSDLERSKAIASEDFVPENNLPLGIEIYKNRIFLSMPKWKAGVPVTLAQVPRVPKEESPQLVPYPNWAWHSEKNCDLITSVFRMYADQCGRLWVLDSGKISITTDEATQHCPPKLLIFDLETDELLVKFVFPDEFIKEDGLYSNIVVDIREGDCDGAHAYMADVWRFGLVIFRLTDNKAWRVTNHLFFPDPLAAAYQLHHLKFEWTDGIFGIALGPVDHFKDDRFLYFHPMSSFREFYVKTSYLRDENNQGQENQMEAFKAMGQSRGDSGHVSSSVMDANGIMYYNLVTRDSIGCWDSRKPYKRENLGVIAKSRQTLVFPNDMRLDKEKRQSMWIITNRLPYYLIDGLDISRINFRVMSAYTDESITGTICDPDIHNQYTYVEYKDDVDCH